MNSHVLRSFIHLLLTEEVFGAQTYVYHGSKTDPDTFSSMLLNDDFSPGKGSGAMYGKGLYTVYDLDETATSRGSYGQYIYKLKINLYGFIIFDPSVSKKVYKKDLIPSEQAKICGYNNKIIKALREIETKKHEFTSDIAFEFSKIGKELVKGIVFTGRHDGRVAVIYDPTIVVPVAWMDLKKEKTWIPLNKSDLKDALSRSASGNWEERKYTVDPQKFLEKFNNLPEEKRIVKTDLRLVGAKITSLPKGLKVNGTLDLTNSSIESLPRNLVVKNNLGLSRTNIKELPDDLSVGGKIYNFVGDKSKVPDHLKDKLEIDLFGHVNR